MSLGFYHCYQLLVKDQVDQFLNFKHADPRLLVRKQGKTKGVLLQHGND